MLVGANEYSHARSVPAGSVAEDGKPRTIGFYAVPAYLARMPAPSHLAELENSAHRIVGFLWGRTGQTYLAVPRRGGETITIRVSILLIAAPHSPESPPPV